MVPWAAWAGRVEDAQQRLGAERSAAAWAEGQAMTLEQAIVCAKSKAPP
jgi:hypothetical protein